ncbi:hypothetical protein SAMN05444392_10882 [Seinonella peptonophila]|uniref:Uncharacterized protein n=1 Tax=Seinonella peptonophila TaxID=112248 RepID=A0A1M4Z7F2_9BACL|nr:hypothetical protein [Seinonella peptonophila]SHF13925.1 hypothetical protein SAMN05444392_10882 [Seinonella peptonophila]
MDLLSRLEQSIKDTEVVNVFSNQYEPNAASVGFIDQLSENQFLMKHITPEGLSDGYMIRRIDDIFRVDLNGEYEQRLRLLYDLRNQHHEDFIQISVDSQTNLFREALMVAQKKNLIVSICIDEAEEQADITGFVKHINMEEICISKVSFNGLEDGESFLYVKDLVKLNCDTTEEKLLKVVYDYSEIQKKRKNNIKR